MCVFLKKKKPHWKHQRFEQIFIKKESLEGEPPPALPSQSWHTPVQANRHLHFSPSVCRPETSGCPSSRWRARSADGVFCECCSACGGVKLFVSPSLGPSVCCGSGGCVRCCGSSSEHTPVRKPVKTDQRLKLGSKTQHSVRVILSYTTYKSQSRGRLHYL